MCAFFRKTRAARKVAKRIRKKKKRQKRKAKRQLRAERRKEKKLKKAEKKKAKQEMKEKEVPAPSTDGSLASDAVVASAAAATTAALASTPDSASPEVKPKPSSKDSSIPQVETEKILSPEVKAAFKTLAEALEGDPNRLDRMVNDHLVIGPTEEIDPDAHTILPRRAIIHSAATTAAQVAIVIQDREADVKGPL